MLMQHQVRINLITTMKESSLQLSWEGLARRTMEPVEKFSWANVQHFVLRVSIVLFALLAENASSLLNYRLLPLRCCLDGLTEGMEQLAFGQIILQTTSWRHSNGTQK